MQANNSTTLIGYVNTDVELKEVGDTKLCQILLGVRGYKKDDWSSFSVKIWGQKATFFAEWVKKGDQVAIAGSLKEEKWESEGQKRSKVVVMAEDFKVLTSKEVSPGAKVESKKSEDYSEDELPPF